MNNKIACAIAFLAGAGAGVAGAWYIAKTKYERIAQEEIDSVKEVFARRKREAEETPTDDEPEPEPVDTNEDYTEYANLTAHYINEEKGEPMAADKPYIIPPEEFADNYEGESLTYYADGVLTDFADNVITNIDEVVGVESLSHFGEYEDDSVFVRNDRLKIDYEILRDLRNFEDVVGSPSLLGEE